MSPKIDPPGTEGAAHLSVVLFDELVQLLIRKQLVSNAEVAGLLENALGTLERSRRASAKDGIGTVRQVLEQYRRK